MFEHIRAFTMASDEFRPRIADKMTHPQGRNEDALCFGANHLVVIDGATGLSPAHLTSAPSDAAWMASRLAELLDRNLTRFPAKSTEELLSRCAVQIREELDELGYRSGQQGYPSACVSVVRITDGRVHCFALGDVAVLLRNQEGSLITFWDDTVPARDQKVIQWMAQISREQGISLIEAATLATEQLQKNRAEMNTEQGYWIFEPTGAGIGHALTAEYDLDRITAVALMSDGFLDLYQLFHLAPLDITLFDRLARGDAPRLGRRLRLAEQSDPACNRYPRFKIADDATVLYAALSGHL